jgi:glycosyltransferase involved in cell wall biosynthesis
VQRAVDCFIAQTYPNKELIIYNTDITSTYTQTNELTSNGIKIVNCNIDRITNLPYTNVGAIRRDALMYATGNYVVTWDDDDIWLPFFMQQALDRMEETGLPSFKPECSFFYSSNNLRLVRNTLEASVVADINKVKEYGYLLETGKEGLGWYTKLRDNKELNEHDSRYIPAYCFNWNDGAEMLAPHKQSGDIDNPNNFENHKKSSNDSVSDRILQITDAEYTKQNTLKDYYIYLYENEKNFPTDFVWNYLDVIL